MKRTNTLPLVFLVSLLTACANTPISALPELGQLQLSQPLQIEANAATARLQYGDIVVRNAVQEHDPFCVFEIDTVSEQTQTVGPGIFSIVGISRSIETIAGLPMTSPTSGSLGWTTRKVGFNDDDSPTHIYFKTRFRLHDANQAVHALTCMSNQNAPGNANFMRHLTMAEIRGALGSWFTLKLEPNRNRI